jgi:hypothetical protein
MTKGKENPQDKVSLVKIALRDVSGFETLYNRFRRNMSVLGRSHCPKCQGNKREEWIEARHSSSKNTSQLLLSIFA